MGLGPFPGHLCFRDDEDDDCKVPLATSSPTGSRSELSKGMRAPSYFFRKMYSSEGKGGDKAGGTGEEDDGEEDEEKDDKYEDDGRMSDDDDDDDTWDPETVQNLLLKWPPPISINDTISLPGGPGAGGGGGGGGGDGPPDRGGGDGPLGGSGGRGRASRRRSRSKSPPRSSPESGALSTLLSALTVTLEKALTHTPDKARTLGLQSLRATAIKPYPIPKPKSSPIRFLDWKASMLRLQSAASWGDDTLLSQIQLSAEIIPYENLRSSIQACTSLEETFRHLQSYYGDSNSVLDSLKSQIAGDHYVQIADRGNPRGAVIIRIGEIQAALLQKLRYFPDDSLTVNQSLQSVASLTPQSQSDFGTSNLEHWKSVIRSPAPNSDGIIPTNEEILMKLTTTL